MLFKPTDINLDNYEEFFILYMDNELTASEKIQVEEFIATHPQLAEELQLLMNTKLPFEEISLFNKDELFSPAMKVNMVDEALLLYIDDELTGPEKKLVEEKIRSNKEYASQHSLLLHTKLDPLEIVKHPYKKELYRHSDKVISFKVWIRVAAAIIILLLGSVFFLLNDNKTPLNNTIAVQPSTPKQNVPGPLKKERILPVDQPEKMIEQTAAVEKKNVPAINNTPVKKEDQAGDHKEVVLLENIDALPTKREVIRFDVARFTVNPEVDPINKTITHTAVTSPITASYKQTEDASEPADPDADFKPTKKTSAKGFFRKVTRFIERNTGIGTVNADNELLIGAVSLKLK